MTRKRTGNPKVQRGVSLRPDLHRRIQEHADNVGLRWNDVVESVLEDAFSHDPDLQNAIENLRHLQMTDGRANASDEPRASGKTDEEVAALPAPGPRTNGTAEPSEPIPAHAG